MAEPPPDPSRPTPSTPFGFGYTGPSSTTSRTPQMAGVAGGFGNTGPSSTSALTERIVQMDDDDNLLSSRMNQVALNNSSGSVQSVIQKLTAHKESTIQLKTILNQVLDMGIIKVNEILEELSSLDVEEKPRKRRTNLCSSIIEETDETLMIDYNFSEVIGSNHLTFVDELNSKISDKHVKNFSQQIHSSWLRKWFTRENSRKHRTFFLKLMLLLAKNDYQNYIPTSISTIIQQEDDIISLVITYVTSNGIIFHQLCRCAIMELERQQIFLSSLDKQRALLEIRNRVDTGQITPNSAAPASRVTRSSSQGRRISYNENR